MSCIITFSLNICVFTPLLDRWTIMLFFLGNFGNKCTVPISRMVKFIQMMIFNKLSIIDQVFNWKLVILSTLFTIIELLHTSLTIKILTLVLWFLALSYSTSTRSRNSNSLDTSWGCSSIYLALVWKHFDPREFITMLINGSLWVLARVSNPALESIWKVQSLVGIGGTFLSESYLSSSRTSLESSLLVF